MTRAALSLGLVLALVACDEVSIPTIGTSNIGTSGNGGFREYLVLGSSMSFEECRARGGIIIQDQGSPMTACDPRVRREPVPADEFDHPGSPVPQADVAAEG